jgi:hypothetical protein
MEVFRGETTSGFDVSWSLHHPCRSMRSPVLALRPCGLVVCSSRPLSVRSAPSSGRRRGVDARQRGGGGAWGTQEHCLRLMGPFPLDQDGGEDEQNEFRLQKIL